MRRLLPNDVLVLRNLGEDQQGLGKGRVVKEEQLGRPHRAGAQAQLNFDSTSESRSRPHQNCCPGRIQTPFWMFYIWMEREFHRASNGTGPTSNFHLSQRESSKQMDVQNLSGCCATIFWPVGPCIVLESIRGASRGLARP